MKQLLLIAALIAAPCLWAQSGQKATYRLLVDKDNGVIIYLPDQTYTPGATRTTDVKEVCSQGAKQFRKTTRAMKAEVDREYNVTGRNIGKRYERDHLIPLELGGADSVVNLWDQEYPQAHWKDEVENWSHKKICAAFNSGDVETAQEDLIKVQRAIADNWYALWLDMKATINGGSNPYVDEGPHTSVQ